MRFADFFEQATGHAPFPFQEAFASAPSMPDILAAPTGSGKTATSVLGWLWRRRFASEQIRTATPRRLVFCQPMRSLVGQTVEATHTWLSKLGLDQEVLCFELRGGAVENDFDQHPDRDMVLIGTQDQLLSRALNRGYAISRFRWPMHYALLNNDCLWVMDEVQLMGVGLSTTAQLSAFRQSWKTFGPTHALWMSATMDPRLLDTVDLNVESLVSQSLTDADRKHPHLAVRMNATKQMSLRSDLFDADEKRYVKSLAAAVVEAHQPGTRTLVVVNRVSRAQQLFSALAKRDTTTGLLHSRYRPADRAAIEARVLRPDWTGILVATQAIEAGVDISSKTLFTELSSWSSIVQRLGRCNRQGEWPEHDPARVVVIDLPRPPEALEPKALSAALKKYVVTALPYSETELDHARALVAAHPNASPTQLAVGHLDEVEPDGPVVRRRDLHELFDTTTDLNGHDIDVSQYIRDKGQPDVQLAFRTWDGGAPGPSAAALHREELCTVSLVQARDLLKRKLPVKDPCYRWNSLVGTWERVRGDRLVPGQAYLIRAEAGGYSDELGWTGNTKHKPSAVQFPSLRPDADKADRLTRNSSHYVTLRQHSTETLAQCVDLIARLPYALLPGDDLRCSAHHHDHGKVHEIFQEMLVSALAEEDPLRHGGPWAKSDGRAGGKPTQRKHFRHELASALAMVENKQSDLATYLVACHHGKVRVSIRSRHTELAPPSGVRFALGVYEGDVLPATDLGDGLEIPETTLSLDLMELGIGERRSWTARSLALLEEWGPFRLALLETLVRVADWRASALHSREQT